MSSPLVLNSQLASLLSGSGSQPGSGNTTVTVLKRTRRMSITAIPFGGDSSAMTSSPCPIHVRFIGGNNGPCTCSLASILGGITGHTANRDYLSQVNVPSRPVQATNPLLVISLDGVVDATLPTHLKGGYTDVISRPYLQTLMSYLLLQKTPWCFVFYTSKPREAGLKILEELNLPTGGPEDDERDGVLGLFAEDDMRKWSGSPKPVKDLDSMWAALYDEEGVRWGVHNTVVLTHDPQEMAKQPYNFIHVPTLEYKSVVRPVDDMFLLLVIAVLKDLETETNFAYHIKEMEFNKPDVWISKDSKSTQERLQMLYNAVRVCAGDRISIRAMIGNKRNR